MRIDLTTKKNIDEIYQSLDFSEIRKNYHDPATNYAFKVMDGVRISGYKMKLACFRHLRDLQRQNTIDFPYYFSTKDEQRLNL
ncbi:hypothetical protein [Fructilactobacillus florum]|uniref:Uncharacterized protein n=1 Tax=Fructilactobacillus florum DSM 22689 = JCM 16035 TaxID=1423745 RepID=A0A0R2CTX1_9LACO|nr:hypothetical protein [Fructilactobacillus florum]KRM91707.1 hypothetical protein FC87_GL000845 [Fructilactobacillus florum DSM 22689 = JCM 16035]